MKKFLLEELCNACFNLNYEEVKKLLNDPLAKGIINQGWSSDDKSYPAPPLVVTLISGVEANKNKDTIKIVKALIRNGADVNIICKLPDQALKQPALMSPLMILMWYTVCDIEIVKYLVQNGADMNYKNEYGMNPLYWAICNPNGSERARYLISAGADIDIQVNEEKIKGTVGVLNSLVVGGVAVTPLQLAAKLGKTDIVKELLLSGANTKIKNGYGWDALQLAKQNENDEVVKLLNESHKWQKGISVDTSTHEEIIIPTKVEKSSQKFNTGSLTSIIDKDLHEDDFIKISDNDSFKIVTSRNNSVNDSLLNLLDEKEHVLNSKHEITSKDALELQEIFSQLKLKAQKKDDIILNLRQQIKQLNKTLQEKDKIIQKNTDTVGLIFHIFDNNLKPKNEN